MGRESKLSIEMGRESKLSIEIKLLINQIIKPIWTCETQFWGYTSEKNITIIQRF